MLERVPLPLGLKPPAHVLRDHHITARRCPQVKIDRPGLVVRRAHQQHRKFSLRLRPVNVRAQRHSVAHLRGHVALHRHFILLRRCSRRQHHRRAQRHPCNSRPNKGRPSKSRSASPQTHQFLVSVFSHLFHGIASAASSFAPMRKPRERRPVNSCCQGFAVTLF